MEAVNFDFPVALENAYSQAGKEAPRIRLVVRKDTNEPIASVSSKYCLVPHKNVINKARVYVKEFGNPTTKIHLAQNGARMVADYQYLDKTTAVGKGDLVGLRIMIGNSYTATSKLWVRIGGIVLKCLNGMVSSQDLFSLDFRHTGEENIQFPDVQELWNALKDKTGEWNKLSEYRMTPESYLAYANQAVENQLVPAGAIVGAERDQDLTAWGLMNRFTYHITHQERASATQVGKIGRLARVDRFFREVVLAA